MAEEEVGPEILREADLDELPTVEEEEQEQEPVLEGPSIDPNTVLELGDRILIEREGGDVKVGTIYYRTGELLRLKVDGDNTRLIDYPREYTEEEDRFDPELQVVGSYIIQKRTTSKFTEQQGFQAGQTLQGWKGGIMGARYRILRIIEKDELENERDAIEIQNTEDETDSQILDFDFVGIPENEPFDILNNLGFLPEKAEKETEKAEGEEETQEEEERAEGEEEAEELLDNTDQEDTGFKTIFIPVIERLEQVTAAKEFASEDIQRSSALSDFINSLPPKDQKDPLILRYYRVLVETLNQMKNDITDYAPDGKVNGVISPSISTLGELIRKTQVPLGRAVLAMKKRLYTDPQDKSIENTDDYYHENDIKSIDNYNKFIESEMAKKGDEKEKYRFYENLVFEYKDYERPWTPVSYGTNEGSSDLFKQTDDMETFRSMIPDIDERNLPGYIPRNDPMTPAQRNVIKASSPPPSYPLIDKLYFGTEQALSATYRKGTRGGKETLISNEGSTTELLNYLFFPKINSIWLGSKRSGSLAIDTGRATEPKITLEDILIQMGQIPDSDEEVNVKKILNLEVEANTLKNNYKLEDYIRGLVLKGQGIFDFIIPLEDYGISRFELSKEVLEVLQNKITASQAQLKLALKNIRSKIITNHIAELNPVIEAYKTPESKKALIDGTEVLMNAFKVFVRQNGILKDSDIAFFTYMLRNYNDLFQAKLGGQETIITKELLSYIRNQNLVQRDIRLREKEAETQSGAPPFPNLCEHVAFLKGIRLERDDDAEFYTKLSQFLIKYRGQKRSKWIMCKECDRELLCEHEFLLIKAFLNPKEKDAIQKDLHLHFSGGMFQSHYICRTCGQPIEDVGYEMTIQLDDEGRPMVGHAPLIDTEELELKELESLLRLPLKDESANDKRTSDQNTYYMILKELAINAGLLLKPETYDALIEQMENYRKTRLYTAEEYSSQKIKVPYETYIYRILIAAAACFLLIEAQTAPLEYTLFNTVPGCANPGLGGYPLNESPELNEGILYMVCDIESVVKDKRDEIPWSYTAGTFMNPKKAEQNKETIKKYVDTILSKILDFFPILKYKLEVKRQELLEDREKGGRYRDSIPGTFLPSTEAHKETLVKEAATSSRAQVLYWMKVGNELAKTHAKNYMDPLSVAIVCCDNPINKPGEFWIKEEKDLISFTEKRALNPYRQIRSLQPHFDPRTIESIVTSLPKERLYPLFLKVCYQGQHKGYSHELGITNTCIWCGFAFGKPMDLLSIEDAQKAIQENKVEVTMETFQDLLDTVHVLNKVEMPIGITGDAAGIIEEAKAELSALDPPPIPSWTDVYTEVNESLKRLVNKDADDDLSLAESLNPLVEETTSAYDEKIKTKYTANTLDNRKIVVGLEGIPSLNWPNFVQVLETYFIKPCKNILNNYDVKNLLQYTNSKFHLDHIKEIKNFLKQDGAVATKYSILLASNNFAKAKMDYFVNQLSAIIAFKNRIGPNNFIGRNKTFINFQKAFLYGPLATLFDTAITPPEYVRSETDSTLEDKGVSQTIPALIGETILHFLKNRVSYDDEKVKLIIADSAEKEKQTMLKWMRTLLTDEERRVMQINKRLKLGRFQIGADWRNFAVYSANEFKRRSGEIEEMARWGSGIQSTGNQTGYHEGVNNHGED